MKTKKGKFGKLALFVIALFAMLSMVRYTMYIEDMKAYDKNIDAVVEKVNSNYLTSYLDAAIKTYTLANNDVRDRTQNDMLSKMSYEQLSDELDGKYSSDFYNIILDNLYHENDMLRDNAPGSTILLANKEGVLASYTNERNPIRLEDDSVLYWEDFYTMYGDPEVSKDMIDHVMNGGREYIIANIKDKKFKDYTLAEVAEVYNKEGLEGLATYRVIVCAKITDTGDILGNPDSTFMEKQPNHKLYIITNVSLYDITKYVTQKLDTNKKEIINGADSKGAKAHHMNDVMLNVTFGTLIFVFVAVLYSDKFEN